VTVNGTNFIGVTAVYFGGVHGTSVTVVSPTRLRVVSPAHAAGTVAIRVVTHSGTSPLIAADKYTFI